MKLIKINLPLGLKETIYPRSCMGFDEKSNPVYSPGSYQGLNSSFVAVTASIKQVSRTGFEITRRLVNETFNN